MAILTQGSQVFVLAPTKADPAEYEVLAVKCATTFTPGGSPADQIETTCLEASDRAYMPGLRTPGQASLGISFDPKEPSHIRLFELSQAATPETLKWVLGWSDGARDAEGVNTVLPTKAASGNEFELPTGRTWLEFDGYLADVPFDFATNTVVSSTVSIQRSGGAKLTQKEA